MPASTKLPVKKYVIMPAKAAMGNAKRKPTTITTIKTIMRKTITSHQNEASDRDGIMICKGSIIKTPNLTRCSFHIFISEKNDGERFLFVSTEHQG
jgi:hypothetical protein